MTKTSLRPRYTLNTTKSQKEVLKQIQDKLKEEPQTIQGQVVQDHAFIRIPDKDQHYWSPELHVWVREQDGLTRVSGVVGPKPKIWTMFMFFYFVVLGLSFFGGIYGIIQWQLDMDAPFLWSIPAGIVGILLVYGAAQFGQKKGKEQMLLLRGFLDRAVEKQR
ncbi:MAG: hypothetical protein GXO89_05525 [Chlorobi bacterium]|nr:hypothetical protein [Chlorobiota bacterium]